MGAQSTGLRFVKSGLPEDPLERILHDCVRILSADRCALTLNDGAHDECQPAASLGLSKEYLNAVRKNWKDLPIGRVFNEPRFYYFSDAPRDPRLKSIRKEIEAKGYRTVVFVPLPSEEEPIGMLSVYFDQKRELSPEDRSTIRTFSGLAAIAVENRRHYEREKEASRQLDRFQELALQVSSSFDLSQVFQVVTKAAVELLADPKSRHSHSRIYLYRESSDQIASEAVFGLAGENQDGAMVLASGEGLAGCVALNRKPLIVPDVQEDPRAAGRGHAKTRGLHHSFIGVPLLASGEITGVLTCLSREASRFTETDLHLLESLAGHAVVAIEKARAFEEIKTRSDRREALRKVTGDITRHLDLSVLFRRICEGVCGLLDVEFARVFVLEESAEVFRLAGHFNRIEKDYQPLVWVQDI